VNRRRSLDQSVFPQGFGFLNINRPDQGQETGNFAVKRSAKFRGQGGHEVVSFDYPSSPAGVWKDANNLYYANSHSKLR